MTDDRDCAPMLAEGHIDTVHCACSPCMQSVPEALMLPACCFYLMLRVFDCTHGLSINCGA